MINYYTSINILLWLTLGILCVLVHEENRINTAEKRMYYLTFAIIALAALAEWTGLQLNGRENIPPWILRLVKCCDYILTPMAAFTMVSMMKQSNRSRKMVVAVLAVNTAFQIVSCFTDWMVVIDGHNHYSHGALYPVYLVLSITVIILIIIQFLIYGRSFRRENRISLYAIAGMILTGIIMQEGLGGGIRTEYIALTIGMALLYIHTMEYSQQAAEEQILEQQIQISTDALTGLLSRHAYSKVLNEFGQDPPAGLAAFSIDVNGLKTVNDTLGHEAGDELICGAAHCIEKTFGAEGRCYRTGGDEFIVLVPMDRVQADQALLRLKREAGRWKGEMVKSLSLSAGYALAADHGRISCEDLIKEADLAMYAEKKAYYEREKGK